MDVGKILEEKLLSFKPGSIIKGTVIRVDKEVIVDFGYKTEGYVLREEFKSEQEKIKPGTQVDLIVESLDPDPNGLILLSKEKADVMLNWDKIEKNYEEDKPVTGTILQRVKGGFKVDIGILA
ncbi:MAG TPA: S1 RNA-binding domain-containing protein, partial [bacterium]|nr:S1 RNA-binding domain-containing protein [bacterium]